MDKITAAQAIRKLAIQFEAMTAAADALESIGSIEQAERECRDRIAALRAKEGLAQKELGLAVDRCEDAKTAAAKIISDANKRADELRGEADATAKAAIDAADADAAAARSAAKAAADKITSDAKTSANLIVDQVRQGAETLAKIEGSIASKGAELTEINARVEQAKSALRAFVQA